MNNLIISSTEEDAGKTTVGMGIALSSEKKFSYFKPFGDRPIYKKKRLIDYDAKLFKNVLNLDIEYEKFCIGFDHSKIRYAYSQDVIKDKITDRVKELASGYDGVIVETGIDWRFGSSVSLDPASLYKMIKGEIVLVACGTRTNIVDDLSAAVRYFDALDIPIKGVVLNKVESEEDIRNFAFDDLEAMDLNVLGIIPEIPEFQLMKMSYINDMLFGKVVAGQSGLDNVVENIYVGAMSVDEMLRTSKFSKKRKLIVTGGDRSDVILASLDEGTSGLILTNDIFPPSHILSKADREGIPMIVVPLDTYEAAKRIERMDKITTVEDDFKINMVKERISPKINI